MSGQVGPKRTSLTTKRAAVKKSSAPPPPDNGAATVNGFSKPSSPPAHSWVSFRFCRWFFVVCKVCVWFRFVVFQGLWAAARGPWRSWGFPKPSPFPRGPPSPMPAGEWRLAASMPCCWQIPMHCSRELLPTRRVFYFIFTISCLHFKLTKIRKNFTNSPELCHLYRYISRI